MKENFISSPSTCPVTYTIKIIGGKWKAIILWLMLNDIKRFGEMYRALPEITKKMLTTQLRELEADGIINREVFAVVPPKVEYTFTKKGESLTGILLDLRIWGEENGFVDATAKSA